MSFHGEHRLTDKVAFHYLIPVIRWIDDRQEQRERPIIYIQYETLHDSYGHATASMHKAFEMLIEHYNVYVVAPSPSNTHTGDYLISAHPHPEFMGTTVVWGSDEFKTWEEIITFFERLGGQ